MTQFFRGQLKQDATLAEYTSWRVGGKASLLFVPADASDVAGFIKQLPAEVPLLWLGLTISDKNHEINREFEYNGAVDRP